jgi:uncharacterized phage protein gp47/JayE
MELSDLAYIDSTGYHFADYPTFRQYFVEKYQAIYGADVYLEDDSQDGQFISVQAKAAYDSAARGAAVYNSFSPVTAQGVGLSRVVKINGISRQSPSYSTAVLTVVGTTGTTIVNGIAQDTLGQKWLLESPVVIPDAGTIDVTATAELIGDVTAEASTINSIFTPTLGWQTVNNATGATPGAPVESDAELRIRQTQSVALPSLTVFGGTIGAVENVSGVTKVKGYENDTGSTDGDGIPAHSICVVVAGGADTPIAQAIQVHKTPGTGTYGDVTVNVEDSKGMPIAIKFQRAVTATIKVQVTITATIAYDSSYEALIQAAIAEVLNAGQIGETILLTKLYAPAYLNGSAPGQTYDVASIEIAKDMDPLAAANIDLDFDQNPVCDPDTDVTVIVT